MTGTTQHQHSLSTPFWEFLKVHGHASRLAVKTTSFYSLLGVSQDLGAWGFNANCAFLSTPFWEFLVNDWAKASTML